MGTCWCWLEVNCHSDTIASDAGCLTVYLLPVESSSLFSAGFLIVPVLTVYVTCLSQCCL